MEYLQIGLLNLTVQWTPYLQIGLWTLNSQTELIWGLETVSTSRAKCFHHSALILLSETSLFGYCVVLGESVYWKVNTFQAYDSSGNLKNEQMHPSHIVPTVY